MSEQQQQRRRGLPGLRPLTDAWNRAASAIARAGRRAGDAAQPVVRALARRADPVLRTVSPLGWVAIGAVLLGGPLGWRFGWIELRTLTVLLIVVLLVAVAFTFGRWNYDAAIELGTRRIRVGQTALGRVVLRNTSPRPAGSSILELPVGRNVAAFRVPRLAAGEEHEEVFQIPGRRRSVIRVGPVRAVRTDPLRLLHRQRQWTEPVELFIHPEIVRLEAVALGFLKDVEGVTTQNLSSSDVSFHALREYVPGDDRRSIHWRTTARVGKLMVRQFEETMRSHLLIVLSLDPDSYRDAADFELAVSCAASLAYASLSEERAVTIHTALETLSFPNAVIMLDQLARLELSRAGGASLREVALDGARRVPDASVAAIVTGAVEPAELRGAQLAMPPEVATFALRCDQTLTTSRRRASNLIVLDVPTLADLPGGVRSLR